MLLLLSAQLHLDFVLLRGLLALVVLFRLCNYFPLLSENIQIEPNE